MLTVGDRQTPYQRLAAGRALALDIQGPIWLRLLARPLGQSGDMSYRLSVEDRGRTYRSYLLQGKVSRRARLENHPDGGIAAANEVVFPLAAGRHRLRIRASRGLPMLLRVQVATADEQAAQLTPARWSLGGRFASFYDDNILRYSEKFIERFERGQDPGRFHVDSLDDVVQRVDLTLGRRFPGVRRRPALLELYLEHRAYSRNPIKDWTKVAASWQQDLGLGRRLGVVASWAPSFYVRHLRDSDLTGSGGNDPFRAFEFDRAELRLEVAHRAATSFDLRYHLGLADFRHAAAFREFDSQNLFAGLRLDQRVGRGWRLSYGLEQTISGARGYDEDGETLATSDDTDPSFRQTDLMLAARYRFPGKRRSTLFLQAEAGLREYTTDKPATQAPLHAGRRDDLLRFYLSWRLSLSSRYGLTVFAQTRDRSSDAPIRLDIGEEKDYKQFELGARVSVRFGTW